jgi:hypothetical protein
MLWFFDEISVPDIKKLSTTLAFYFGFPNSNTFSKYGFLDCSVSWFY